MEEEEAGMMWHLSSWRSSGFFEGGSWSCGPLVVERHRRVEATSSEAHGIDEEVVEEFFEALASVNSPDVMSDGRLDHA